MARVGVLALQGDFAAHTAVISQLGQEAAPVRTRDELNAVDALILPGGESSAMLRLMHAEQLMLSITERIERGMPTLATCAGVILLACRVFPNQESLGLLDIDVARNAYGRQVHSSVEQVRLSHVFDGPPETDGVLIRAPRITRVGDRVDVLGWFGVDPVLVRQGRILGATFHPELGCDTRIHDMFLTLTTEHG